MTFSYLPELLASTGTVKLSSRNVSLWYVTLLPRAFFVFNSRFWTSTQDNCVQVRQRNRFMVALLADEPAKWHFIILFHLFQQSYEALAAHACFGDVSSQEIDVITSSFARGRGGLEGSGRGSDRWGVLWTSEDSIYCRRVRLETINSTFELVFEPVSHLVFILTL